MTETFLAELYSRPGFLLKRCHQVAMALFTEECKKFNLTPSQYGTLGAIHAFPGIDQVALGRIVGMDRTTTSLVIKLLSERDAIIRTANPRDKRRVSLRLTEDGARLLIAAAPAVARTHQRVLSSLPAALRGPFVGMLQAFLDGHQAAIDADKALGASNPEQ